MMMIPRKRNEFDLFRDFFEGDDFFPIRRESAIMKTDIKEKKDKYIIEMDLPGYEKENINLSLKDGYLEVTAEVKKEDDSEEKDKFVHKERYYGHCSRSFYVGEQIKEEDVNAEFIREVECVNDDILGLGSGASDGGRGGMKTKLEAAKLVTRFGGKVLIANGKIPYIINKIFNAEELGTMFIPSEENLSGKKRWIGYATNVLGKLVVNEGAKSAILEKCTSLLPIGIVEVVNDFKQGEVVSICDENGYEFARGMVNYSSDECRKIAGAHSGSILKILGYKNYDAVITRDNITDL